MQQTLKYILFLILFLSNPWSMMAQDNAEVVQDTVPSDQVIVDFSDIFEYIQERGNVQQRLLGNVELRQDSIYMYCDSATIIGETDVIATGNVVIQQGDSINIFADSLVYLGEEKLADLYGNVVLVNGANKLFTDTLNYDLNTKVATYDDGALLTDDTTQLTSRQGYYYVGEDIAFFKDSVVVVHPEFELKSDTLQYHTRQKLVTFLGPTLITQNGARIYCESGNYDLTTSLAEFRDNAQYVTDESTAMANIIRYEGENKVVSLIGNASFEEEGKLAEADVIRYDEVNDIAYLEGGARYLDDEQDIRADSIIYDRANDLYSTRGRGVISNPPQVLEADIVDYDKTTGLGVAKGNVIWRDTSADLTIICAVAQYDEGTNYLEAVGGQYGRPVLITDIDGDSLFLSADTLVSLQIITDTVPSDPIDLDTTGILTSLDSLTLEPVVDSTQVASPIDSLIIPEEQTITDTLLVDTLSTVAIPIDSLVLPSSSPDTSRLLLAYNRVRLYKSNLQAVCDSLTYNLSDSLFQFFDEPVVWSDTSQFSADTIRMQMANDNLDRIFLHQNAFILNSPDEIYFNQVKGRQMIAFFDSSELRRMEVEGNAESVYYGLDESKAYVGVNKTLCSEMVLFFGDNQVLSITFFSSPQGNFMPMRSADHTALRLAGFLWQIDRRPESRDDIY